MDIVIFGLLRGAIFALSAFGFSLVLGVLGIVNLAHGIFVVLGAGLTFWLVNVAGVPLIAACALAALASGLLGALLQRTLIARVFSLHPFMVLVQTFGIAVVLTEALNKAFGTSERVLRVDLGKLPPAVDVFGTFVPTLDLIVFAIALVSAALLFLLLQRTEFGRAVRACRDSRRNAELVGIDAGRIYMLTMLVCGVWAGLAGSLLVMLTPTAAYMHFHWTIDAFLVVVIGGMGSMAGALAGGFLYGILNFGAYYLYPTLAPALIFGTLILLLIARPQGLFSLGTLARK